MIQGASLFHLAKGLYRRGFFPTRVIMKALWLQVYFRVAGQENAGHIEDARSAILGFIEGHTVAEVEEIADEVYEESIAGRIWPGTRAIAQMHLDVGQQVWLVTAAPVEVAGIIAARLGLTGALGTTADARRRCLHRAAEGRPAARSGQSRGRPRAGASSMDSILPAASRTRTPTTTCRCCRWSATRARSTPTAGCWRMRKSRTGRSATTAPVARRRGSALLGAGAAGATAGAVATGLAVRRSSEALTAMVTAGLSTFVASVRT